jgi:hypothetical protein
VNLDETGVELPETDEARLPEGRPPAADETGAARRSTP